MIAMKQEEEMFATAPRVTSRGHLELLDWERPQPQEVRTVEGTGRLAALPPAATPADPIQRSRTDRWFDRGIALLFVATTAAVCVCMAHL